jgi:hypothetical protein
VASQYTEFAKTVVNPEKDLIAAYLSALVSTAVLKPITT